MINKDPWKEVNASNFGSTSNFVHLKKKEREQEAFRECKHMTMNMCPYSVLPR